MPACCRAVPKAISSTLLRCPRSAASATLRFNFLLLLQSTLSAAPRPHALVPALIKAGRLSFPCSCLLAMWIPLRRLRGRSGTQTMELGTGNCEFCTSFRAHYTAIICSALLILDPWIPCPPACLAAPIRWPVRVLASFMIQLFAIRCWRHQQ